MATIMAGGLTVEQVADLELAFPTYSAIILMAARDLKYKLDPEYAALYQSGMAGSPPARRCPDLLRPSDAVRKRGVLKPVRRATESCALAGLNFLAGLTGSPLRAKVDTIATDDVLAVLKPIWTAKAETASRVRGPIEKVLDAAKGFREGENPARWRGHLDHLLPRPSKLARRHHAAMPYEDARLRMTPCT